MPGRFTGLGSWVLFLRSANGTSSRSSNGESVWRQHMSIRLGSLEMQMTQALVGKLAIPSSQGGKRKDQCSLRVLGTGYWHLESLT